MKLPDNKVAITALNYGRGGTSVQVDLTQVPPGYSSQSVSNLGATDVISGQSAGVSSGTGQLTIDIDSLTGKTVVVKPN
jgi:hypothetical protein